MADSLKEEYWSRFPDSYDAKQEYVAGKGYRDCITNEINSLPELGELLEIGCGTGYFTETIAAKAGQVVAADLSEELLAVARKRLADREDITFQTENCYETSFPAGSFDSVFMANLLHVIEHPGRALEESRRILRKNGTIVIASFTGHGMKLCEKLKLGWRFTRTWGKPPAHTHTFSPQMLEALMVEAGFTVESMKVVGDKTKALFAVGTKTGNNH